MHNHPAGTICGETCPELSVASNLQASGFHDRNFNTKKVRIELPITLPPGCQYGVFVTSRSQEDGITRLVVANPDGEDRDDVALEIHPDGSLHGNTKGWAVDLHEADDAQGMLYIWMCPLCGQPMKEGDRCNSGVHQGPDTVGTEDTENDTRPFAVRSIDLACDPATIEKVRDFIDRHSFERDGLRMMDVPGDGTALAEALVKVVRVVRY